MNVYENDTMVASLLFQPSFFIPSIPQFWPDPPNLPNQDGKVGHISLINLAGGKSKN